MASQREPDPIVYPQAPLRAVAIELQFEPLLDAQAKFGAFQRRHRSDFSRVVEAKGDDDRPRTGATMLMASDRSRAISVARDQVSAITYVYAHGFAGFTQWAVPLLQEGLEDLQVASLSSVSFRYENRIVHDTRAVDLSRLFRFSLAAPPEAQGTSRHVHLYWHQIWREGTVEVDLNACPSVSKSEIHLNITSHCGSAAFALIDLQSKIDDAHRIARLTFEDLITTSFRDALRAKKELS